MKTYSESDLDRAHQMARRGFFGACAALVAAAVAPERVYSFGVPRELLALDTYWINPDTKEIHHHKESVFADQELLHIGINTELPGYKLMHAALSGHVDRLALVPLRRFWVSPDVFNGQSPAITTLCWDDRMVHYA